MKKLSGLIIISLSILFVGTQTAGACTCKGRPQGVKGFQTCSSYWYSEAVFIGLAEKVTIENYRMTVKFSVEKTIRGVAEKTVEVFTSASSASCGYPFKEGERYFVYARKGSDGRLGESLCGPTTLLKDAEDDLEYVKELESGKLGSRIFGNIYEDRQKSYNDKRTFEKLGEIEVTIKGSLPARSINGKSMLQGKEHTFKTTTNENGFYIFKDIPEGVYRVTAKFPKGLREIVTREDLIEHFAVVNADGVRCDSENFVATRQGSIRGAVVGFPVNDIKNYRTLDSPQPKVSLFPLDENGSVIPYRAPEERWAYRDKYEFYFNVVPAGKYLLTINPNDCPHPNNGVPPMYFPGVADKSDSKIIIVGEGENLRLENFRALPMLKERWFSGIVLYQDKTSVANATVRLLNGDMSKCNNFHLEVKTDEFGRFRVKGFETYKYQIDAFTDRKQGQKQLYSKPFVVPQTEKVDDIQLILDISL